MNGMPPGISAPAAPQIPAPPVVNSGMNAAPAANPAGLDIPSVPSSVNNGFLQDIPTLSPAKKPAA